MNALQGQTVSLRNNSFYYNLWHTHCNHWPGPNESRPSFNTPNTKSACPKQRSYPTLPRYQRHNPSINATHDKPSWQTVQRRSTLTLTTSSREIPGSISGRHTAWTGCFALYFSPSKTLVAVVPRAGHDRFLRNAYRSTSSPPFALARIPTRCFPAISGGTYMLDKQFGNLRSFDRSVCTHFKKTLACGFVS